MVAAVDIAMAGRGYPEDEVSLRQFSPAWSVRQSVRQYAGSALILCWIGNPRFERNSILCQSNVKSH
jgi:hypothetical protein